MVSIQPANKTQYFKLDLAISQLQPGQSTYVLTEYWFKYIQLKYPELTTFCLLGDPKGIYPAYYNTEIAKTVSKSKHLSVYSAEMFILLQE